MHDSAQMVEQARILVARLERISADSIWARRSSGARGALLRWVERFDDHKQREIVLAESEQKELALLLEAGFFYLERAAHERLKGSG